MMNPPHVAVMPAIGIGDALLMMIASHQLHLAGCKVTTFHSTLPELSTWFPDHRIEHPPSREDLIERLSSFDKIIIENDNSSTISLLRSAWNQESGPKLSIFYPSYSPSKHLPLSPYDQVFISHHTMADNIERSIAQLINVSVNKNNGISPPSHLRHRQYSKRVIIHPTSRDPNKNWLPEKFLALAENLEKKKFFPVFSVSPVERNKWLYLEKKGFSLPFLPSLSNLSELIYESGFVIGNDSVAGHLASNLNIPSLVIANDPTRMRLWQPGWLPGKCIFPPPWIPNIKGFRWREKKWQHFISVRRVLKSFKQILKADLIKK